MKRNIIFKLFIIISVFCLQAGNIYSQEENENEQEIKYKPSLKFSYLKNSDDIKILKCIISARVNKKWKTIENAELSFHAGTDSIVDLGKKNSDVQGIAIVEIGKEIQLPVDENGAYTFTVEYAGTENSESNSEELTVTDVNLELELEEIDSVKTILAKAFKKRAEGNEVPVAEQTVNVYVKRLYSNLKVGEIYLDEEGEGSLEYRLIPGDSIGNIVVIARFDDHEEFANVEKRKTINWGTPVSYEVKDTPHEIWTNVAPTWMTVTVIIFVLGVWYHLILVFIRMWKIKKIGKEIKE